MSIAALFRISKNWKTAQESTSKRTDTFWYIQRKTIEQWDGINNMDESDSYDMGLKRTQYILILLM